MTNYNETINNLFAILALANKADSDEKQPWQVAQDASQNSGLYGHIRAAIVEIAGEEIVNYWEETSEVDLSKATRNQNEAFELRRKPCGQWSGKKPVPDKDSFIKVRSGLTGMETIDAVVDAYFVSSGWVGVHAITTGGHSLMVFGCDII